MKKSGKTKKKTSKKTEVTIKVVEETAAPAEIVAPLHPLLHLARLITLGVFSLVTYLGTGFSIWLAGRTVFDANLRSQDILQLLLGSFFLLKVVTACLVSTVSAGVALAFNSEILARNRFFIKIALGINVLILCLLMIRIAFLFVG